MSNNFDWRTEEDEHYNQPGWDAEPGLSADPRPGRRLPWRLMGIITALVVVTGAIIWWRVDQRIDATMQAVRSDVIASHNLIQRAAVDGDEELFRSLLSGREPSWTDSQFDLFHQGLLVDRRPFGLEVTAESLPAVLPLPDMETGVDTSVAAVEVSSDLNEALVTVDHPFREVGRATPVFLQQTTVYRRGDQRWLLSPPTPAFWGDWNTANRRYLSLIYPQRDSDIAERLLEDVNADIERLCQTLVDVACSADLYLTVRLDDDPATLVALTSPMGALRRAQETGDILELPAPSLIGVPVTDDDTAAEAGYQALRRAYTRQVAGAVVARAVNWRCCASAMPFQILLDYQLSQLGLGSWPVGEAERRDILDNRVRLNDLRSYWYLDNLSLLTEEQSRRLYTGVDFLLKAFPATSAAELQGFLARSESYRGFLDLVLSQQAVAGTNDWIPGHLNQAFWLYALQGEPNAAEEPSDPPTDDLYMVCTSAEGNASNPSFLFRYVPETGKWEEAYRRNGFVWMGALPDLSALLLQEYDLLNETWRTNIWSAGEQSEILVQPDYTVSFGETTPDGRKLLTYGFESNSDEPHPYLVDLDQCDESCVATRLPGLPRWSPDGSHALYFGEAETLPDNLLVAANHRYVLLGSTEFQTRLPIALGPGDAEFGSSDLMPLGNGYSPFWLDEKTFGFIRSLGDDVPGLPVGQEIVVASLDNPEPQLLISSTDIFRFLPESVDGRSARLAYVATHPERPNTLFIVALDTRTRRAYIFLHDVATGETELRLDADYEPNHSLGFSPDGRFLLLTGQERDSTARGPDSLLLLHDIDAGTTTPFLTRFPYFLPSVVYDWTRDSRRLALVLDDNLIAVVSPDERNAQVISHNYGACTSVAWQTQ